MKLTGEKHEFLNGLFVKCSCGNRFLVFACENDARCANCGKEKEMAGLCRAYLDSEPVAAEA